MEASDNKHKEYSHKIHTDYPWSVLLHVLGVVKRFYLADRRRMGIFLFQCISLPWGVHIYVLENLKKEQIVTNKFTNGILI